MIDLLDYASCASWRPDQDLKWREVVQGQPIGFCDIERVEVKEGLIQLRLGGHLVIVVRIVRFVRRIEKLFRRDRDVVV